MFLQLQNNHFISCTGVAHCCVFYLPPRLSCTHTFNPLLFQGLLQGGCLCSTFPPPANIRVWHPPLTSRFCVLRYWSTSFTSVPTLVFTTTLFSADSAYFASLRTILSNLFSLSHSAPSPLLF